MAPSLRSSLVAFGLFAIANALSAQAPLLEWRLEAVPPSRNRCSMARHEGIDATVLFGGESYEAMDDTWLWRDGWRRVSSPQAPRRRHGAGMVYDGQRQRLVLFGGYDGVVALADTWAFDGVAWTQLSPLQSPPARHSHAMGYDSVRDRVVAKGGLAFGLGVPLADLWEFDGATWVQRVQAGNDPGGGQVGRFVFDAPRQEMLLFGLGITAWNGVTWTSRPLPAAPQVPVGTPVYDAVGQRVLMFPAFQPALGPQPVFAWQGEQWSLVASVAAPTDRSVVLAYDATRAEVIGLRSSLGSSADDRSHTFVWRNFGSPGSGWQLAVSGLPTGRAGAAFGYDLGRRRAVLCSGAEGIFSASDLYEADDRDWSILLGSGIPVISCQFAYDTVAARSLLLGVSSNTTALVSWSGSSFTYATGSNTLPLRFGHGLAYDSVRQRLLVFGGDASGVGLTNQLWAWTGTAWANLTTSGPSARRDVAMCYDPLRDRLVVFGGANANWTTFFGETWEHDGTSWQLRTTTNSPAPRAGSVLVYASHLQQCILVGGFDAQDRRDTWAWDGSDWSPVATVGQPDTGRGLAGLYDPDRREIVLFGGGTYLGADPRSNRGELWRLVDPTLATWQRSGLGCDAGSGLLRLEALDPPAIDTTCRLELQNTLASFVALPLAWAGFDDEAWGGVPLPFTLDALGAPGCSIYTGVEVPIPMLPLGTRATGSIALPDVPAALGLRLHFQGAVWNFANGAVATSDLLTATVGPQ